MANTPPHDDSKLQIRRAVYSAMSKSDLDSLCKLIAEHPEFAEYPGGQGETWLHKAAGLGSDKSILKFFLEIGDSVNAKTYPAECTPLEGAVRSLVSENVKFLLEHGADPNISRPIIGAIRDDEDRSIEILSLLLDHGADINRSFSWFNSEEANFTALEFAEMNGLPKVAAYLRSRGAVDRVKSESPLARSESPSTTTSRDEEVVAHFEKQYGRSKPQVLREIVLTGDPIAIHVIPPNDMHKYLTLFTTGMSAKAMAVPPGQEDYKFAELLIHLPPDWPLQEAKLADPQYGWPILWLRQIARYPHEKDIWLGGPFTIIANGDPPEPLAPNTELSALMLAAKSEVHCQDGTLVQLYTLVPIYTEERNVEIESGLPELLKAFDQYGIDDVVDLDRLNVATAKE